MPVSLERQRCSVKAHQARVALYFMHYNFARVHKTLLITPAMAAGITDHVWSLEEIAMLADEAFRPTKRGPYNKRIPVEYANMMIFGPVSSVAHSAPTVGGALFPIGVGASGLIYVWFRFFRSDDERPRASLENMIGMSLVCCTMIGLGIWEWIRALRISN